MLTGPSVTADELKRIPVRRIIEVFEKVSDRFLDSASSLRAEAVRQLSAEGGFSAPMAERALDWTFSEINGSRMRRLLVEELGSDDAADDPALRSPRLTVLIAAGSIFQPAVNGIVYSLLIKSPILVKCSSQETRLLPDVVRAIRETDEAIGNAAHARLLTRDETFAAIAKADTVVAYGSDETIAAVRGRIAGPAKLIGHGHRISAAAIGRGALRNIPSAKDAARDLALDIAMYDQTGCLSPHCVFIETGGEVGPGRVSEILAEELSASASAIPPAKLHLDQAALIRSFRNEMEFRAAAEPGVSCVFGDNLAYGIVVDPGPEVRESPLGRTIVLKAVENVNAISDLLTPLAGRLQGFGARPLDDFEPLFETLRRFGASYFCDLGRMQRPPLDWKNAGIPCLRGLFREF